MGVYECRLKHREMRKTYEKVIETHKFEFPHLETSFGLVKLRGRIE